jgi:hypothetical protein
MLEPSGESFDELLGEPFGEPFATMPPGSKNGHGEITR